MSRLLQVSDKDFDKEIIHSGIPVMVDFWAEWCKPCKAMEPMIEELAREYQGKIRFAQMNVVNNRDIPARFGIRNLPTLMFFKGGKVAQTIIGGQPRNRIDEELQKLL